jgi:predicted membrane metal-binding protein
MFGQMHYRLELPIPWHTSYLVCLFSQLAAIACAIVAARRGSRWWLLTLPPSAWLAFVCLLGDL